ncbi:DUF3817 domain-containing protein [Naumannella sp. ID2617S]|nr:DUF3817 domain-containing protein [Naumannella sp. ID2617S]
MTIFASPVRLYRALALAEVVTWALLLIAMAGKYLLHLWEIPVRIAGSLHGFTFLSYCAVTVLVAVDQHWRIRDLLLGLGSAILPFATVPFERSADRRGLLGERWRLRAERPATPVEHPVAWGLRNPVLAGVITLAVLAGLFALLLRLGPPTQWVS